MGNYIAQTSTSAEEKIEEMEAIEYPSKYEMICEIISIEQKIKKDDVWYPKENLKETIEDILLQIELPPESYKIITENEFDKSWKVFVKTKKRDLKEAGFKGGIAIAIREYIIVCEKYFNLKKKEEEEIKQLYKHYKYPPEISRLRNLLKEYGVEEIYSQIVLDYKNIEELRSITKKDLMNYGIRKGTAGALFLLINSFAVRKLFKDGLFK